MSNATKPAGSRLKKLADDEPQRHDIFIGLVAPIGSSRPQVVKALRDALRPYEYAVETVRLADLLDDVPRGSGDPLPERAQPGYYQARMDAGDTLRREAGDWSALAALAVARTADRRSKRLQDASRGARLEPVAYVFDSLKHPREAALLRSVYGPAFWLISIVQDIGERIKNLADELAKQEGEFGSAPEARASELIARDESDPDAAHGQHVRDVFGTADFFLPVRQGVRWRAEVDRLLEGVFDAPFLTPRNHEEAMRHADAAALRSAAIGRQVGAVIVPPLGAPFLLGTNEVPKPGGGQYREGDEPDHRDFQSGADPNPAYTQRVIRELVNRLAKARYFTPERSEAGGDAVLREALAPDEDGKSVLDGARAKSLIEFTRCLHAEQAAIVDAARTGVAIQGARLYTTTFPCHECTKFIVGSGIVEVQYIEPYPKSLAGDLYGDLIDALPPMSSNSRTDDSGRLERIPFRAFLGFGPARFDEVFSASERRSGEGIVDHTPREAAPVGLGWSEIGVRTKESEVSAAIFEVVQQLAASAATHPQEKIDSKQGNDVPDVSDTERPARGVGG